jgi:hypothetical protein
MSESLRPVIADILDGLVSTLPWTEHQRQDRLWRGADSLRWVHDREEAVTGSDRAELERLRELVGEIESVLDDRNPRTGKPAHPGVILTKVTNLIEADQ